MSACKLSFKYVCWIETRCVKLKRQDKGKVNGLFQRNFEWYLTKILWDYPGL